MIDISAAEKWALFEIMKQWNPWWEVRDPTLTASFTVPRDALMNLERWIRVKRVLAIQGLRGVGKSTLMRQLIEHLLFNRGVQAKNILFVNLEDPLFIKFQRRQNLLSGLYQAYFEYAHPSDKPHHLFLSEIQNVNHWASWIRVALDKQNVHIYLSGSSSRLLEPDLASVLTGRHHIHTLRPFSFREFCRARELRILSSPFIHFTPGSDEPVDSRWARVMLMEYLEYGGLPEVVLTKDLTLKKQILKDLFRDILFRDIVGRHQIHSITTLEIFAQHLLSITGQQFTCKNIMDRYGLTRCQMQSYLSNFVESYLISQINCFDPKIFVRSRAPRVIYASDVGLRNAVSLRLEPDTKYLAKTVVYQHIREVLGQSIFYFQGRSECDFIILDGTKPRNAIQICWQQELTFIPKQIRIGLLKAMDELDIQEGLVLTDNIQHEETLDKKRIRYIPLWRWLLELHNDHFNKKLHTPLITNKENNQCVS